MGAFWVWGEGWRGLPVGAVEGFDCFGVEVFDGLFVTAADAIFGAGVAVEGVDCFGDAHLGGCHCCGGDGEVSKPGPEVRRDTIDRCSLPRNESRYPFASFCSLFAADSMVR